MDVKLCKAKYKALAPALAERARRIWAATEARAAGRGGITMVARGRLLRLGASVLKPPLHKILAAETTRFSGW